MLREQTGLSELSARAAQARNFSEPVVWEDSDTKLDYFKEELERINLDGNRRWSILKYPR